MTYAPNPRFSGADSFTYKANDGQADSNVAIVTINATNSAPLVSNKTFRIVQDNSLAITLNATDADSDNLTFSVTAAPTNGTLSGQPPALSYTPTNGYTGNDSFTFKVNDGTIDSAIATVTITVSSTSTDGTINNTGNALTLDGNLTDWNNYTSFGTDPDDVSVNQTPSTGWKHGLRTTAASFSWPIETTAISQQAGDKRFI